MKTGYSRGGEGQERNGLDREGNRGIEGNGREQKGPEGNRKEWKRNRQDMPENVREWKRTEGNRKEWKGMGERRTRHARTRTGQDRTRKEMIKHERAEGKRKVAKEWAGKKDRKGMKRYCSDCFTPSDTCQLFLVSFSLE